MKHVMIMMAASLISAGAFAQSKQDKDIPAAVKSAFQKAHPDAKAVKWEKEGENFEAEFGHGKTGQSVVIDAQGNILETEVEIAVSELPKKASDYVSEHYKGQSIKEAAKITDAKGTVTYEAEIKGKDLMFDAAGTFLKETKE